MSVKLSKKLSSKKKKPAKDNAQTEILRKLGLDAPLDPASILDISTWTLEIGTPLEPKDLPKAFLQRLWLLDQDARSPFCQPPCDVPNNDNTSPEETPIGFEGDSQCIVNPLDLVTGVYMSANTFLQQEMAMRMVQCQFAVPLVLPNTDPEEPSRFLLWPLRGVVSQWMSHSPEKNYRVEEGDLASTCMSMVSCVKLGHCSVSKSKVLNHVLNGLRPHNETFLHRGVGGGQVPRRLANGLVEIRWCLPTGDITKDIFPVPVVISNLRGDASAHEMCFRLLCQASSALVIFCGDLREKDKQLLVSCKDMASKLILIDLSDTEVNEKRVVGFVGQNLEGHMGLPEGSVLPWNGLSEEELAYNLCDTLKNLLPDRLKPVTLEAAEKIALELGLNVDEGAVCKKAMATVEDMLKGLDEGSSEFRLRQLPLQGVLWRKLAELEKEESKQKKEGKESDTQLQTEKKDIMAELCSYRMTSAMKIFTDALYTTDKAERTYFLSWLKLRLRQMQTEKQNSPQELVTNLQTERENGMPEHLDEVENLDDSDSFCTDSSLEEETEEQPANTELQGSEQQCEISQELQNILPSTEENTEPRREHELLNGASNEKGEEIIEDNVCFQERISHPASESQNLESGENGTFCHQGQQLDEPDLTSSSEQQMYRDDSLEEQVPTCSQMLEPDPSSLGLEHFLREMGLIFELTHISPGSGSHNVLRFPSLAADLLLYGIPLELMDGESSNIPTSWLGCVFAELKRRLPQEQCRTRVLTNLGVHHSRNAEVLSTLFGVTFPEGRKRSTRGLYMIVLCLPDNLRKDMECDFLLLIDVEGLCSFPQDSESNTLLHDNEMATVAAGVSDILLQNISSHGGYEFETNFTVMVNALLRTKECGNVPVCQLLSQDEGLNSILQVSQLKRVSNMLQTETKDGETTSDENHYPKTTSCVTCVNWPWSITSLSEPVDTQYSKAILKLKENLFGALKVCADNPKASGLPEFMKHLSDVWDSVKADSFSISLQNTDIALAFSLLCTEFSQWEDSFLENTENWLMGATQKIFAEKAKALDAATQNEYLSELKNEAREEVKAGVSKVRSKLEAYLAKDAALKSNTETFRPVLLCYMDSLQDRVTEAILQRLETVNESHCSSSQMKKFETLLDEEQESKLYALAETSKATKMLLQDTELEEEFEGVWSKTLSNFDFRPSETEDITARVTEVLKQNLISCGHQKHIKKLEDIGQTQTSKFQVYDEHFGYRSRLKHMFEDNNRQQRLEAQQLAYKIIEEYNQFVEDKCSLPADFSDSYITELLENVEKALKEKPMEIKSAFEVDLKVHLCANACKDFQKLHDRYAKDRELLRWITTRKDMYSAEFIYNFRKRDQCQRVAQAFSSMVIKPTVLDYIHKPLGMLIVDEIQAKAQQYQSPRAFHQSLLEELIKDDQFESFLEYLLSYDNFRLKKIQDTVVDHLSESTNLGKQRQQRLGEIVGKISAAVSQAAEGTNGVLRDTKPLLESVCLTLQSDGDVDVNRESLTGPLFSITTEWDCFVKHLMELLATMRLDLFQEFSQNVDISQLLEYLPDQPHDCLFNRVKGCDKKCPLCGAPCEEEEMGHVVHKALLHRPKGLLPNDSSSLSCITGPENTTQDISMKCQDLHSLYPDWSISPDDPNCQKASAYWRYVLARFGERFSNAFNQEKVKIPEEWRNITQEEALDSLNEALLTRQSG
ncbi:interferon-induced very large GTPase 1 [Mugil cephalus]|uniref:interferon-induced very large GTPase 1 n=1 Tax=Mugil cephalus TaxID=48193 RepID=UPI001FB77EF9|nr:interferon-induced very large GTPase 1 [Mugil cephalus]